jgi:hypothetical protein
MMPAMEIPDYCHSEDGSNEVHSIAVHIGPPTAGLEVSNIYTKPVLISIISLLS